MNEKTLEKKFREAIKEMGGLALKFTSPSFTGMPDRLILMPGGFVFWAEFKTSGKKPTLLQESRMIMLRKMNFKVYLIDCDMGLETALMDIENNMQVCKDPFRIKAIYIPKNQKKFLSDLQKIKK